MKEMVNKDKMVFFALLIGIISYFGYINLELCKTDEDFIWFTTSILFIIISSILFYVFIIIPQIKDDDFDGGRYWLSLYLHKN